MVIASEQIMPYKKQFVPFEFYNPTDMILCRHYIMNIELAHDHVAPIGIGKQVNNTLFRVHYNVIIFYLEDKNVKESVDY